MTTNCDSSGTRRQRSAAVIGALALAAALLVGCGTSRSGDGAMTSDSTEPTTAPAASTDEDTIRDRTARANDAPPEFGIGAMTAYQLGYRVDWRTNTGAARVNIIAVSDDSAFVLDDRNFLTRIRVDDGARIWRTPVANPVDEILGVTDVPEADRVYLTAGGDLLEVERASGGLVGRQKLEKIANTKPVRVGPYLVYGSRNGQVVWHSFAIAFQWRASQVGQTIRVQPAVLGDFLAVIGSDGELMVLSSSTARAIWSTRLLDTVQAPPTLSDYALYVAGLDQHLRAYDIRTGRTLWKVLTRSALTTSPVLIDGQLYQQIPADGLVCFDALPIDSPGGKRIWTAKEVSGTVISRSGRDLVTWDADQRVMQIVDEQYGSVKDSVELPNAAHLICSSLNNGDLYVIDDQGVMSRVVPRN